MRMLAVSVLALGLAACGSSGGDRADGEIQMKAGKWAQTMVVEEFDLPGAPPQVAEMLKGMIGQEQKSESCMTEDQVAKGWEEQAKNSMEGQDCVTETFDATGGSLNGKVVCKSPGGAGATMAITGDYGANSMNMKMAADIEDPKMPGGKGKMVMSIKSQRVGECDAATAAEADTK